MCELIIHGDIPDEFNKCEEIECYEIRYFRGFDDVKTIELLDYIYCEDNIIMYISEEFDSYEVYEVWTCGRKELIKKGEK